jgi:hypothetical protein
MLLIFKLRIINYISFKKLMKIMGIGDWGLGIGDWGLGPIPNPQSPNPNPHPQFPILIFYFSFYNYF